MVNNESNKLDYIFTALSDSTRRQMLQRLAGGQKSVAELAAPFDISKSAITKHLKMLERAGLLSRAINGRVHLCSLEPEALAEADEWLTFYQKFWNQKLDRLQSFIEDGAKEDS